MFENHYIPIHDIDLEEYQGLKKTPWTDFESNGYRVHTEIEKNQWEVADTILSTLLDPILFAYSKKKNIWWKHTWEFPDNLSKCIIAMMPHCKWLTEATNYFIMHEKYHFPKPVVSAKHSLRFLKPFFDIVVTPRKWKWAIKSLERFNKTLQTREEISFTLFPQWTRNPKSRWMYKGFYKAAEHSNSPILFMTVDYVNKHVHLSEPFFVSNFTNDKPHILKYLQKKLPHEEIFFRDKQHKKPR